MDMPPQALKNQVRTLAANQDAQSLRDGASLQAFGNRLPVLQAFQEFLELERRRARRRLIGVALTFLGVLVAILIIGGALFATFAHRMNTDISNLQNALAVARNESGALRGDTQVIQRALDEAKVALAELQRRSRGGQASSLSVAAFDFGGIASALEVLQKLQNADAEASALGAKLESLRDGMNQLAADRVSVMERQQRIVAAQGELGEAIARLNTRRGEAEARLKDIQATSGTSVSQPMAMGKLNKRGGEQPVRATPRVATPVRIVALLDELSDLRLEHQDLVARQAGLGADAAALEKDEKTLVSREISLRVAAANVLQGVQHLLAQQEDLRARIEKIRTPSEPSGAVPEV
ncbi:MAG: hypothetical protein M5U15_08395 [Kiritimatiellae bacterium]|nr:hypothetical protein [Kiritimatiellia bacterium]